MWLSPEENRLAGKPSEKTSVIGEPSTSREALLLRSRPRLSGVVRLWYRRDGDASAGRKCIKKISYAPHERERVRLCCRAATRSNGKMRAGGWLPGSARAKQQAPYFKTRRTKTRQPAESPRRTRMAAVSAAASESTPHTTTREIIAAFLSPRLALRAAAGWQYALAKAASPAQRRKKARKLLPPASALLSVSMAPRLWPGENSAETRSPY